MVCYTTSNMKCLGYKSSLLARIKQLGYFLHLGFRTVSVKPSPQQCYQLTLKHALAQAGGESGRSSFSNIYFQVCPSVSAKLSRACLAFSALIQLRFANIWEQHTKADWSFSKWHSVQTPTMHHIKCSYKCLSVMFLEPPGFLILLVTTQNSSSCSPDLCFFFLVLVFSLKPSIKLRICKYRLAG